jgi:hypothetical protein
MSFSERCRFDHGAEARFELTPALELGDLGVCFPSCEALVAFVLLDA